MFRQATICLALCIHHPLSEYIPPTTGDGRKVLGDSVTQQWTMIMIWDFKVYTRFPVYTTLTSKSSCSYVGNYVTMFL